MIKHEGIKLNYKENFLTMNVRAEVDGCVKGTYHSPIIENPIRANEDIYKEQFLKDIIEYESKITQRNNRWA